MVDIGSSLRPLIVVILIHLLVLLQLERLSTYVVFVDFHFLLHALNIRRSAPYLHFAHLDLSFDEVVRHELVFDVCLYIHCVKV